MMAGFLARTRGPILTALAVTAAIAPAHAGTLAPPSQEAPPGRPTAIVDHDGDRLRVELVIGTDTAVLQILRLGDGAQQTLPLERPSTALLVLADQRLAPLWPALLDWAGPDLGRLRARALAASRVAFEQGKSSPPRTPTESSVRPAIRALLQYSGALSALGYTAEADALLRNAMAANPMKTDWDHVEFTMVAIRLAGYLRDEGDMRGAITVYRDVEQRLGDDPYTINAAINRAAIAAETGEYADALALIDATFARFTAASNHKAGRGGEKVPGSLRQFGWIKACALQGLGRTAEAMMVMGEAAPPAEPTDRQFVITPSASLRLRAAMCMGDVEGAVREVIAGIGRAPAMPAAFLWLQPAAATVKPYHQATWAAVRADPRVVAVLQGRMHVLSAALLPALNNWASPIAR
jgi:tetratricopeptide (TPR) repeat protein